MMILRFFRRLRGAAGADRGACTGDWGPGRSMGSPRGSLCAGEAARVRGVNDGGAIVGAAARCAGRGFGASSGRGVDIRWVLPGTTVAPSALGLVPGFFGR
ncbi:hypothetical protein [Flaviflexus equikiangi]|uniref:hypothetical protein n=1 Tax=Flaviflexus equikiangi TaxID=2758573 RepID=UPI0015F49C6C|nr:hypothetical protein [Flaviflexus equikiangi]